jgi:hypothetical protein
MDWIYEISGRNMNTQNFMAIGADIKVILRLLPLKFEMLQCTDGKDSQPWHSGGIIHIRSFMNIDLGLQTI